MRRRQFILTLGGLALTVPFAAKAQQPGKLRTIGFLGTTTAKAWSTWNAAFVQRLRELGWIEGSTVAIEYRWAEGRDAAFIEIANEFARLKVDVIVTSGGAGVAAKQATSTIPIVLAVANDPLGAGLVTSLARPGGNVPGLSLQSRDLVSKRLGLLREVVPSAKRLGILANVGYPASLQEMDEVETTARALGFEVYRLEIRRGEDIAPAFDAHKDRLDALYVGTDPLISTHRLRISTLALAARLPTVTGVREYIEAAALMSYGPSYSDLFRRAGDFVDKILRGANPAELPVEQPTKFELAINLATAKALGLTIPSRLLFTADEVFE
jgi:putative ABC transport system substrate-binding protein